MYLSISLTIAAEVHPGPAELAEGCGAGRQVRGTRTSAKHAEDEERGSRAQLVNEEIQMLLSQLLRKNKREGENKKENSTEELISPARSGREQPSGGEGELANADCEEQLENENNLQKEIPDRCWL